MMEMEKSNRSLSPVAGGLLISLMLMIVTMLVAYISGLRGQPWTQWLGYIILVSGIAYVIQIHAKQVSYLEGFGDLFAYGFRVTTVIICIMILFTILFTYLNPEMKDEVIQATTEQALKQPGVREADLEKFMEFYEKNFTLVLLIGIIFSYLILGLIGSLIGAAIAKKKPTSPFDTIDNQS